MRRKLKLKRWQGSKLVPSDAEIIYAKLQELHLHNSIIDQKLERIIKTVDEINEDEIYEPQPEIHEFRRMIS